MNVPVWIKLAAASKDELYGEILTVIEEMGGIEAAQKALRQLGTSKSANWVLVDRFVTAQTLNDIFQEEVRKTRKDWEDNKIINKPVEERKEVKVEAPVEIPKEEVSGNNLQNEGPQKLSGGAYLATLLGLLLGTGLTAVHLKDINLKQVLDKAKAPKTQFNDDRYRIKPQPNYALELSPEDFEKWIHESKERIEVWERQIADMPKGSKKQEQEKELREFEFFVKLQIQHAEKSSDEEE